MDAQPPDSIWTTSITVFEIRFGLELLVAAWRGRMLEDAFASSLEEKFEKRVAAFDASAAEAAGRIAAKRRRAGRPVETRDVQIAGIVAARRATRAAAISASSNAQW